MKKAFLIFAIIVIAHICAHTLFAAEERYSVINKKNLFHPERKEWIKGNNDGAQSNAVKSNLPKVDPNQIQLMGTIITKNKKRALIRTSKSRSQKSSGIYRIGDYIKSYFLVSDIKKKQVVLQDRVTNENLVLYVDYGKKFRSGQKTALRKPSTALRNKVATRQNARAKSLINRMEKSLQLLKKGKNKQEERRAKRYFRALQRMFSSLSEEQKKHAMALNKKIEGTARIQ